MKRLRVYDRLDRLGLRGYRAKIMATAFVGTHIPLIALAAFFALQSSLDRETFVRTMAITLAATLAGTGLTLFMLHELLRPVSLVSQALRAFRARRELVALPSRYGDEVGTLMADAGETMAHLERAMVVLETVDPATGLPNRARAIDLIEDRAAGGEGFAAAVMRFEGYARIAEALGLERAQAGAVVLADRLRRGLGRSGAPGGDVLARVSPSEFALVLTLPGAGEDAEAAAIDRLRRLIVACSDELVVGGARILPELSCGVALFPSDARHAVTLLDHAAGAAACSGPNAPVVPHSPRARAAAEARFRMEAELRRTLAKGKR